jgi:hypothetical protein
MIAGCIAEALGHVHGSGATPADLLERAHGMRALARHEAAHLDLVNARTWTTETLFTADERAWWSGPRGRATSSGSTARAAFRWAWVALHKQREERRRMPVEQLPLWHSGGDDHTCT